MKNRFTIREAAQMADTTAETLRHYDRIGLVSPHETDPWTGYRYYSEQEIVRLHTIRALRCMDLTLKEIQTLLEYDDLEAIVSFLKQAETRADDKIVQLEQAKAKIIRARSDYEKKLAGRTENGEPALQTFPARWILCSDTMEQPTVDNLWQYHSRFYDQIAPDRQAAYTFADLAGIYTAGGRSQLFALCLRYPDLDGLTLLPAGTYLCAPCSEEDRADLLAQLVETAGEQYGVLPAFTVQVVVISGILQWSYQLQIPISSSPACS